MTLTWSRTPFGLLSIGGEFRIVGPVNEPGYKGYKLLWGGEHIETHKLLRDAKASADELGSRECEHKWRDYSEYGGDFEKTPVVCRDCGTPAPPEIVKQFRNG